MAERKLIAIEVAYASPQAQAVICLEVGLGTTIQQAIEISGILAQFPEINLQAQKVGIFGSESALDDVVKAGERIEIYRSLQIDPKDARRAKAKKINR